MPVKHSICKSASPPEPLKEIGTASEQQFEDMVVARPLSTARGDSPLSKRKAKPQSLSVAKGEVVA